MNENASNALLPEDELQAALAEIERMSGEDAAAIPDLDDGLDEMDTPSSADGEVEGPAPARAAASQPSIAGAAPGSPMDEATAGAPSASDESGATDPGHTTASASSAPVESVPTKHDGDGTDCHRSSAAIDKPAASAGGAKARPDRKLRFTLGKKSANQDVTEYTPPAGQAADEADELAVQPTAPLTKRVYRTVDRALDAVNRPFERLGEDTRRLVGYVGLATLAVSILAIALMSFVFPHRDAIVFVHERVAKLEPRETGK